jgi:cytochrome c556
MRKIVAFALLALLATGAAVVYAQHDAAKGAAINSLPASLDELFPPKAHAPLWLLAMYGMNQPFCGIIVDLNEGDRDGMLQNFQQFKEQYEKTAGMVPEWSHFFAVEPVAALGAAVQGGDPGQVMAAVEQTAATCENCHLVNMVPVVQKYHWPDFQQISATDPMSGQDVDWKMLMQMLNTTLTGITVDLEQGQTDNARKQAQAFAALFGSLKETCDGCHDTERAYYVDARVQSLVDQLGTALAGPAVDTAVVASLSMKIGTSSCTGCHMVHVPAALAALTAH